MNAHAHHWHTTSTHATSNGVVIYLHCRCGAHSVMEVRAQPGMT